MEKFWNMQIRHYINMLMHINTVQIVDSSIPKNHFLMDPHSKGIVSTL